MKSCCLGALVAVALCGAAHAETFNFPSNGTTARDAILGPTHPYISGADPFSVAGDMISQTFSGALLTVDTFSYGLRIASSLGGSDTASFTIVLNNTTIGTLLLAANGLLTPSATLNFASIGANGSYAVSFVLQNTIPPNHGLIDFLDGGTVSFLGAVPDPTPIPGTVFLMGGVLGAGGLILRWKRNADRRAAS